MGLLNTPFFHWGPPERVLLLEDSVMSEKHIGQGVKIQGAIIGEGAIIVEGAEIDGTEEVFVVGYNEKGVLKMKIDKYSAILKYCRVPRYVYFDGSSSSGQPPVCGKYRLIDFLSSLVNGIVKCLGIFQQDNITHSIFDHIRPGREWGLSTPQRSLLFGNLQYS